jgi:hypothetical protein
MANPTPEALATAEAVFTLFMHDRGMPGWIWHRQATPDNVELVARIAQTLAEQAQAHEACIAEMQADALAMAHRENELHDEKDKTLAEQAREIAQLKTKYHDAMDILSEWGKIDLATALGERNEARKALDEQAREIERTTWAAAITVIAERPMASQIELERAIRAAAQL